MPLQISEHFVGQRVDEAASIPRGLKAQAMLARSRFGQRETAVDARQAGFVRFSDVAIGSDGIYDDSRQLLPKGLSPGARCKNRGPDRGS
jgi:hypothetical protein